MPHEVIMPALGMTQDTGVIVAWRKAEGDAVAIGDPLFDVETDKTTMEVAAAHVGTLTEIRASAGANIPVGDVIAIIAAPGGAGPNLAPALATPVETKAPTPSVTPSAQSTPSAVPILASPKARFEAHRRGIDLRRLVDQGIAQPFHVADLDRLQPERATALPLPMSQLSATLDLKALDGFVTWAEEKTGCQRMRSRVLAMFAAAAFRSRNASNLIVTVMSTRGGERAFRNPDLRRLSEPDDDAAENGHPSANLALVDLIETRFVSYHPPNRSGRPTLVLVKGAEGSAFATLHFSEDDLPLPAVASFLEGFAERIEEPAMMLL